MEMQWQTMPTVKKPITFYQPSTAFHVYKQKSSWQKATAWKNNIIYGEKPNE